MVGRTDQIAMAEVLAKSNFGESKKIYESILAVVPSSTDEAGLKTFEQAVVGLGKLFQQQHDTEGLTKLVKGTRGAQYGFSKAKTAKLVRQLLELFAPIPGTVDLQVEVTQECIEWAKLEKREFLRQTLETRLVSLYMEKESYYQALSMINQLLQKLKKLDVKLTLVEVQLLESRAYHELGNIPKARAALTSARTSAASVFTPIPLQAGLDLQSGMLHAEEQDFGTAFSYFIEAFEGFHSIPDSASATKALQYKLLCKIMLNSTDEVVTLMASEPASLYASPQLTAMKEVAKAYSNRSLLEYERTLNQFRGILLNSLFVTRHLRRLHHSMMEQNLVKVIEPYSRVEISHIAELLKLNPKHVEQKLSQMILDKLITGVLDQGSGCLIIYEESKRDGAYDSAIETMNKLSNVVDVLFTSQASQLV